MNIEDAIKYPYEAYCYSERYINFPECFRDKLRGNIKREYSSFDGDRTIILSYLTLPLKQVTFLQSSLLREEIKNAFLFDDTIKFPIHPQVLEQRNEYIKNAIAHATKVEFVSATPTASMRTLLTNYPLNIYVKTHFPERISSSKRGISLTDIKRGIWISDLIHSTITKNKIPEQIGFMPDLAGLYIKDDNIGAILRDSSPLHTQKGYVLPLASLFAPDKNSSLNPLIAEQLAERNKQSVETYITEEILTPHIKGFFWLIHELGTVFTPHGQNALVQFDSEHSFVRYIHRDFQGKRVLPSILNAKGIPLPDHKTEKESNLEESLHLSLSYDMAIGKIFYDRMINSLKQRGHNTDLLIQCIKDLFHTYNKNPLVKFNRTHVEYTFENGVREVKDTKEKPKYR